MEINFVGEHKTIERVLTPYHSLNQALRGDATTLGFPTRTMTEVYGPPGSGKTTFAVDILAHLSRKLDDISIAALDLEIQDDNMIKNVLMKVGYRGKEFRWIDPPKRGGKKDDSDETLLGELIEKFYEDPPYLGFMDSVASISPISEQEGEIGDANWGRRGLSMAQFTRKVVRAFRTIDHPSALIMTNHEYIQMQTIGGAQVAFSPGGRVKDFEAHLRLRVKVPYVEYISSGDAKKEGRWDEGWILEGKVEKNRSGAKNRKFQVFIVGGWGIHKGLTDVVDCLASGIAKISGNRLELDGRDYGSLKKIIANQRDDDELFAPFANALMVNQTNEEPERETEIVSEAPKKRGRPKKEK